MTRHVRQLLAPAILAVALGFVMPCAARAAVIINPSFEAGFTGYTTLGDASIQTAAFGSGPVDGSFQALLSTTATFFPASAVEIFLGLPSGSLDGLGNGDAVLGSALRQDFLGNAGDVISFQFNFLTVEETPSSDFNDFAFTSLSLLQEIADTNSVFVASSTVFPKETGFQTFTVTLPTTGTYSLGIGIVDVSDFDGNSGLLIDAITTSRARAVPEPGTLALIGAGLAGMGFLRRRQN
jgi:hypothetical protein